MSDSSAFAPPLQTPFPIHRLAHNYYLYSINLITALRATHNIPGTLIGTLPQCPQQNVFAGLPLLLSPAETRVLVQKRVAYIVDDVKVHREGLAKFSKEEREKWRGVLRKEGQEIARRHVERMEENREKVLEGMETGKRESVLKKLGEKNGARKDVDAAASTPEQSVIGEEKEAEQPDDAKDELLFSANDSTTTSSTRETTPASTISRADSASTSRTTPEATPSASKTSLQPHSFTPTVSHPPLSIPPPPPGLASASASTPPPSTRTQSPTSQPFSPFSPLSKPQTSTTTNPSKPTTSLHKPNPNAPPPSTPKHTLHAHLSSKNYFLLPGLRFGCHFSAYPGDPLRFHSHFLCRGYGWDEEISLVDLVGGGRLGTGVKKGFLVGGRVEGKGNREGEREVDGNGGRAVEWEGDEEGEVRCFCIEWGGM